MRQATAKQLLDSIDAIVIAYNERSTRSHRSKELIKRLRRELADKQIVVVRLKAGEADKNRQRLVESLQAAAAPGRALLIVGGGDGTAHFVAEALLHQDTPAAYRTTPVTPWPLGNGNDFFNSVHAPAVARDPLQTLLSSQLHAIHVHPLEWRIQDERGEVRRISLCYGTIGATGSATEYINEPGHRERRKQVTGFLAGLLLDSRQAIRALWFPRRFRVTHKGHTFRATELQFNNGPIMTLRIHYPVLLSQRGMFVTTSRSRHPLAIAAAALRLGMGAPPGAFHTMRLSYQLSSDVPIHAQTDGEPFLLPAEVRFSVGPGAQHLVVWATKEA